MSSTSVSFSKYHGCGNDFVVVDGRCGGGPSEAEWPDLAQRMLNRHLGIGGDQLLVVQHSSHDATARMRIFNADGREAEMCGNGLRAVALFLSRLQGVCELSLETLAGVKRVTVASEDDIRVEMGSARSAVRDAEGLFHVNMGNPHVVVFVPDPKCFDLGARGRELEQRFDANVEAVAVTDRSRVVARVWERSVGETQACGSGACAVFAAARSANLCDDTVAVAFPGGTLTIRSGPGGGIVMTGPARHVFDGVWPHNSSRKP